MDISSYLAIGGLGISSGNRKRQTRSLYLNTRHFTHGKIAAVALMACDNIKLSCQYPSQKRFLIVTDKDSLRESILYQYKLLW